MDHALNIQVFAGANGYAYGNVELTQGEQAKYANSIMRALGQERKMPLQGWFAESASKKEAYSVFYLSGRLAARDIDDTTALSGPNYIPTEVKGQNITDFLKAVRVYPTGMECPVYIRRRDFDRSQLDEKSAIVDAQTASIYAKCSNRIATLFKDIVTNKKRNVEDTNGKKFDLTIPEGNFYGDKAQLFDTDANIKAFRMMMLKAQELAEGQGLKIAIVAGTEGRGELANAKRFSDRDFSYGETTSTGQPLKRIFGGTIENLPGFDSVFYSEGTETEGRIIVMIEKSFGQDNKDVAVTPEANYIADKKAYLLDVEVYNSTELLNPEGVFIFTYKRDVAGAAMASVLAETRTFNGIQQPDVDKMLELEKARTERAVAERTAYEAKLKLYNAEKNVQTPDTAQDTTKAGAKAKAKATAENPDGTTE